MSEFVSGEPSRATGSGPWTLAIDFGTTYTTAAIDSGARTDLIEIDGSPRVPSVVLLSDEGGYVVGQIAERQVALAPDRAELTPKRRMGDDLMLLGGRPIAPVDLVAAVLRHLHSEAVRQRGGWSPAEVLLTHPVRWADHRLAALATAARRAGIAKPRFVPEPVAAAMYIAEALVPEAGYLAVYDLGGGTLDTAVLRRTAAGFEVMGLPGGDDRFGGENLDEMLYTHLGRRIAADAPDAWESLRFSSERPWRKANHDLRTEVRRAKEALSTTADYRIYVGAPLDRELQVTRSEFETLVHASLVASVEELEATVARAGLTPSDLAAVALVGGSSRIPLVSRLVADRFGRVPETWGDPKSVVVLGALRAGHLAVEAPVSVDHTPLDVTPLAGDDDADPPQGELPARVGDYDVVAELGRGGMGVVYLAKQPSLHRLVAVKTLPSLGRSFADRLQREAAVLAELQHPHLATVLDVGLDGGSTYVVMPWFPGGSLAHVLRHQGALRPGEVAGVLAALAEALDATHRKGFLHRDIKPSNVLLSEDGDPYLADFGLALSLDSSMRTTSRQLLGTAGYTAPEVVADEDPTPASDVFSLGVCGYQLLTGRMPFAGRNLLAIMDAVRSDRRAPLADVAPDAPGALVNLIEDMLASDPSRRPRDLRRLANQLRIAVEVEPVQPAPPPSWAAAALAVAAEEPGLTVADADVEPFVDLASNQLDETTEAEGEPARDLTAGASVGAEPALDPTGGGRTSDDGARVAVALAASAAAETTATLHPAAASNPLVDTAPVPIAPDIRKQAGNGSRAGDAIASRDDTDDDTVPIRVHEIGAGEAEPTRRRGLLIAGAGAALAIVIVIAMLVLLGGGGSKEKNAVAAPVTPKAAELALAAASTANGVTVDRTWKLSGNKGDQFEARIDLKNPTAAAVTDTFIEVVPKSIAKSADKLDIRPGKTTLTVVEADPVLSFAVTLEPGAKTTIVYRADVPADGATRARLQKLADEQTQALTEYQVRTGAPVVAVTSHTEGGTLTDGLQTFGGTVTEGSTVALVKGGAACDVLLPQPVAATVTGTTWTMPPVPLAAGPVCLEFSADRNGKVTTTRITFTYAPPAPVDLDPDQDGVLNDGADKCPDIKGNQADGCVKSTTVTTRPPGPRVTTPPATAPPATAPPVTAPPVTAPPVTAPPVTQPPTPTAQVSGPDCAVAGSSPTFSVSLQNATTWSWFFYTTPTSRYDFPNSEQWPTWRVDLSSDYPSGIYTVGVTANGPGGTVTGSKQLRVIGAFEQMSCP